jgi:hypothetical protein
MIKRRGPPPQTWRSFLANYAKATIALDFFTVPTPTVKVLFVLIILSVGHLRRILSECAEYYDGIRTHLFLAKDAPEGRLVQSPSRGIVKGADSVGG